MFLLIIKSWSARVRLIKCLTFKLHKHCCMAIVWNKDPECCSSQLLLFCIAWEFQVKSPEEAQKKGNLWIAVGQGCSIWAHLSQKESKQSKAAPGYRINITAELPHQNTDSGKSWVFTRVCETPSSNFPSPQACRVLRARHDPSGISRDNWRPRRGKREGKAGAWDRKKAGDRSPWEMLYFCVKQTEINLGTLLVTAKPICPTRNPRILLRPEKNK